jgi:uncharacterized protein (DUF2164 family)
MPIIEFSKQEKEQIVPLIQEYLRENLDCDVGNFDAEFLLDFFSKEIGGFIYNRALTDVHALLEKRLDSISESIYELEKPVAFDKGKILSQSIHGSEIEKGEKEMSQYLIVYLGGEKSSSPEEGKKHFAKYQEWLSSLGSSAISPMNPIKNTSTVNPDGSVNAGSTTAMSGYTIVEAESIEAAISIAKACPFLDINGSLEVSELIKMPG